MSTPAAYALEPAEGGRLLALRSIVGLSGADPEQRSAWIDIAYPGEWHGHADGPFKLTAADFDSCITAFESQANPIPGDFEHASLNADGAPKPASMWIQKLKVEDGHLKGLAEFTPEAAGLVRSGGYRFNSGVFAFAWPDRKTGEKLPCVLRSVALTNDPFLDGQQPIALTARKFRKAAPQKPLGSGRLSRALALTARGSVRALSGGSMTTAKITKADILAGLKMIDGDEMSPAQFEALLASLAAMAVAKDPKAGEAEEAEPPSGEMEMTSEAVIDEAIADEPALAAKPAEEKPLTAAPVMPDPVAMAAIKPPPSAPEAPPAAVAEADAGAMLAATLLEATGLGAAELLAAVQTNKDAVVSAIRGQGGAIADLTAAAAGTVASLSAEVAALTASVHALTAKAVTETTEQNAKTEADSKAAMLAAVDGELASKGILPALVPQYRALAAKDHKVYREFMDALPAVATYPTGRNSALSRPDTTPPSLDRMVDETEPRVMALRAMYKSTGKSKEAADLAVLSQFGTNPKT